VVFSFILVQLQLFCQKFIFQPGSIYNLSIQLVYQFVDVVYIFIPQAETQLEIHNILSSHHIHFIHNQIQASSIHQSCFRTILGLSFSSLLSVSLSITKTASQTVQALNLIVGLTISKP